MLLRILRIYEHVYMLLISFVGAVAGMKAGAKGIAMGGAKGGKKGGFAAGGAAGAAGFKKGKSRLVQLDHRLDSLIRQSLTR